MAVKHKPKKTSLFYLLLTAALIASCGRASQPQTPDEVLSPSPTGTSDGATSVPTEKPGASCYAVGVRPTPGPTEVSIFPPVSESDRVVGGEDAVVTFIFYGDYQ
jgi:hypothetical protein